MNSGTLITDEAINSEIAALERKIGKMRQLNALKIRAKLMETSGIEFDQSDERIEIVISETCMFFGVNPRRIRTKTRQQSVCFPRQVIYYLLREQVQLHYQTIADAFNVDHGTVIHGVRVVKDRMETQPKVRNEVNSLTLAILNKQ